MTPADLLQQILLTTAYHYTPERGVMVLVVNPLPRTPEEVVAWFQALTPADWQLALVGAVTASSVGLLVVLGTMALLALARWRGS